MIASSTLRQDVLARRQEQVLGQLLRDGRAAGDDLPLLLVLFDGFLDAFPVEAFVIDELVVLGSDDGALEVWRNPFVGHPLLLQLGLGILDLQFGQADFHETRRARIDPVPPQHPAEQPELPEQNEPEQPEQRPFEPARARRLMPSIDGAVRRAPARCPGGRRARPERLRPPARPACPGRRQAAPRHARGPAPGTAVSPLPYIMS